MRAPPLRSARRLIPLHGSQYRLRELFLTERLIQLEKMPACVRR
jgi:hypothetical protein